MADNKEETKQIKKVLDEETVEQLVENRHVKKKRSLDDDIHTSPRKRKQKKNKNYSLRVIIVLLCAVILFTTSFLTLLLLFKVLSFSLLNSSSCFFSK